MQKYFYIGKERALFIRADGTKIILDLKDVGTINFVASDIYEPDVTKAIATFVKPGGIFIDVGANLGIHALAAWRAMNRTGLIFAVEANSGLFDLLQKSTQLNGAQSVVRTVRAAAWSHDGELAFSFEAEQHRVGAVRLENAVNYGSGESKVKAIAIDSLEFDRSKLNLIKIDVEGREPFVIEGAQKTIRQSQCAVICEYHQSVIESTYGVARFQSLVETLGLKPHGINGDGKIAPLAGYPRTHANLVLLPA